MFLFGKKSKSTVEDYIVKNLPGKVNEYEGKSSSFLPLKTKNFNLEKVLMFQDEEEIMLVNFYSFFHTEDPAEKIGYMLIKKDQGEIQDEVKGKKIF